MRKKTIHELRESELKVLIARNPELGAAHARKLMNSFYRLCGLSWQNLQLENDERMCNTQYAYRQGEREQHWYERLNTEFKKGYSLDLKYCGCMPAIGVIDKGSGGFTEVIERHLYE